MFVFHLSKETISIMADTIKEVIGSGEREIAILYSDNNHNDDLAEWKEEDFNSYASEINKLAELAGLALVERDDVISINVLSNVLVREQVEAPAPDFVLCQRCVCTGCMINKLQFKLMTGFENIPPVSFCRRSFIEYGAARHFVSITNLLIQLEDIGYKEFLELIAMACGNVSLDLVGGEKYGL
jgi:hypothetical protein